VVRDFSAHDVLAGTHVANLREVAERRLRERGATLRDIRAREIRADAFDPGSLRCIATRYRVSTGEEIFLEQVTPDDRLVAFLRLSLPGTPSFVPELSDAAVVRELHVYGMSLSPGTRSDSGVQHAGLGAALLDAAAARAREAGFRRLAVISAVGTRAYYRGQGFRDGDLYQHLDLQP
jgi:elongator complex protein 3